MMGTKRTEKAVSYTHLKKDRLGHLYVMMGKEATDVKSAKAGDIIVVPKLTDTRAGDTMSKSGDVAIDPLPMPVPQYPVAIEAANKKDEDKLGTFLARAAENDPTLIINRSEETHQTVITAMGEAQIETLIARLKEQTGVEAKLIPVRIPYRETIRKMCIRDRAENLQDHPDKIQQYAIHRGHPLPFI